MVFEIQDYFHRIIELDGYRDISDNIKNVLGRTCKECHIDDFIYDQQIIGILSQIIDEAEMPKKVKAVGVLHFFDRMDRSDIATECEISYGTVGDYIKKFLGYLSTGKNRRILNQLL